MPSVNQSTITLLCFRFTATNYCFLPGQHSKSNHCRFHYTVCSTELGQVKELHNFFWGLHACLGKFGTDSRDCERACTSLYGTIIHTVQVQAYVRPTREVNSTLTYLHQHHETKKEFTGQI
eukprot:scpid36381/ scgid34723/ 